MRADYIRIYKSVHTWTGILTGMALFIAFYAGALTVFKEPLTRWATPPAVVAPVPLEEAPALIARTCKRGRMWPRGSASICRTPNTCRPA